MTTPDPSTVASDGGSGAALALIILIAAVAGWIGLRQFVQGLRAQKTRTAVGDDFGKYALEALTNAAKIDGRVSDTEQAAITQAMRDLTGASFDAAAIGPALANARLSKDELVAYLAAKSRVFSREQKTALLKALLSVFSADGRFDEVEHAALVDYTAAVGFDRQSAPEMLRSIARDFQRGRIT
ncbi:MAG: TerB family tellurite resistance protein [Hyphomonadaceae bacterium]|nr:TerB family tellurite resistance protein [Hyphomonadaceae bacterium]